MAGRIFHIASEEEIRAGLTTDVYFVRTRQVLRALRDDTVVEAEFMVKKFPPGARWGVLAGMEEAARLLDGMRLDVRAMEEGTLFGPYEPVLSIKGRYADFAEYETPLLGLLCQATGIATKSARLRKLAGERSIISFGARRMHPALAPMIDRSAYLGGCDGVSVVKSAELLGLEPTGTMPHALILVVGDVVKALKAFDRVIDKKVRRVALVDTIGDEKFEALRSAEALGKKLFGVRLDTPASRRGDFLQILKEVRWELDLRGFRHVKLFVSGGIDEEDLPRLNEAVDAYGIGTAISNAPTVDFAMDIVEINGKPMAKRGKLSGAKQVLRCLRCFHHEIVPEGKSRSCALCRGKTTGLLKPLIRNGRLARRLPGPGQIRSRVLSQLRRAVL